MPDAPDDLDDVLRRAMASLDGEAPAGYFDALADRTLARLDDPTIGAPIGPAIGDVASGSGDALAAARDGDAGLDDIRGLASETVARLSARRAAQAAADGDVAASSATWSAVALPDPSKQRSSSRDLSRAAAADTMAAGAPAKAARAPRAELAARPIALPRRRSRFAPIATAGVAVAAAAAVVLYLSASKRAETPAVTAAADQRAAAVSVSAATGSAAPIVAPEPPPPPSPSPSRSPSPAPPSVTGDFATGRAAGGAATAAGSLTRAPATPPVTASKSPARPMSKTAASASKPPASKDTWKGGVKPGSKRGPSTTDIAKQPPSQVETGVKPGRKGAKSVEQPPLDELIGESSSKKKAPPKLDRESLSTDDILRGMGDVADQAQACYSGTQGTASLRLTVAPSGQVTAATVTGSFAGTAVGTCVERAVRSARFPPWEGRPQSFGYSYLLSD
jgi:hypothetical protein